MADRPLDRWLRPRYVFALLALLIGISMLISSPPEREENTWRLSTYDAGPYGAKGLYLVLARLGWRTTRADKAMREALDTTAIYLILDPEGQPIAAEVGVLMHAVRHGALAIVVPHDRTALADSIGVRQSAFIYAGLEVPHREITRAFGRIETRHDDEAAATRDSAGWFFTESNTRIMHYFLRPTSADSDSVATYPQHLTTLLSARGQSGERPVMMEEELDAGRVLAMSDPEFLRNDGVRQGGAAVLMVRLLERLDPGRSRTLVFDEFNHGFGEHGGPLATVWWGLTRTAIGRAVLQIAIALLVLLIAIGVRPIAPAARLRIERRSPFEHVGALSRAYEQIGATRLAARRLVRGLRRRHPVGATDGASDEAYLTRLAARTPALAGDTRVLLAAMHTPRSASELSSLGAAIDHIERMIVT